MICRGKGRAECVCAYLQFIAFYYAFCGFFMVPTSKGKSTQPLRSIQQPGFFSDALLCYVNHSKMCLVTRSGFDVITPRAKLNSEKFFWFFPSPSKVSSNFPAERRINKKKLAASQSRNIFLSAIWTDDPNSWFLVHSFRCWPILNFMRLFGVNLSIDLIFRKGNWDQRVNCRVYGPDTLGRWFMIGKFLSPHESGVIRGLALGGIEFRLSSW